MNLALWILFGALVGWIASLIIDGLTIRQAEIIAVLGVIAGIIGGWLANLIGQGSINNFNLFSVVAAVFAAGLCTWFYGQRLRPHK
jgi:uncharacterized membrane protein YeaQ/YmgE (transglycosylase-associated protein family)